MGVQGSGMLSPSSEPSQAHLLLARKWRIDERTGWVNEFWLRLGYKMEYQICVPVFAYVYGQFDYKSVATPRLSGENRIEHTMLDS